MSFRYPDFQKHNFRRSASWRWERACRLQEEGARLSSSKDDGLTLQAVKYLGALGSPRCPERPSGRMLRSFPGLHAAHHLHEHGGEAGWELEARLLARQSSEQIGESIPLNAATIDAYEAYFFNVRDRIDAADWVAGQLIGPGLFCGFGQDLPGLWKAIGYSGGPLALEVVLVVTSVRPGASRYSDDVLRRVQRLLDVLMLPPDASLNRIEVFGDVEEGRAKVGQVAADHTKVSLDEAIGMIGEVVEGARSTQNASSTPPNTRPQPRLGKKVVRGATAEAA